MITGQNVHNQRIERLWRDVFTECTSYFYTLFYALEESGLLDHNNEADVFALHIVYLDEIQRQLNQFREGWNHYTLFYALEESGLLDHNNEADVFALHIVYLDEIQRQLAHLQ